MSEYTKLRWICTIIGLMFYTFDIGTDLAVAVRYYIAGDYIWSGLTLMFMLLGYVGTQVFSYAWYRDDMKNVLLNPNGDCRISGMSKHGITGLHLVGMGVFTRYYHLLKKGYRAVWSRPSDNNGEKRELQLDLFGVATDLSMLKLFETFLESVPQLMLQVYIILGHNHKSIIQYVSLVGSFCNITWSMVDYRRCLRRSLTYVNEMPSGLPTVIYLLYKLFTITSHILSFSLLLVVSLYSAIALGCVWLLGTFWAYRLQTHFCTSKRLEYLYRAVTGVILTFTFFNVKGQGTRTSMIVYYVLYSLVNLSAPALLVLVRTGMEDAEFFWPVTGLIVGGTLLGLLCLVLYYTYLHPREKVRLADEVDGLNFEPESLRRMREFLQP